MSRIGNSPISIPAGVTVDISKSEVTVKGPKGELKQSIDNPAVHLKLDGDTLTFTRDNEEKATKAYHGLIRSLVNNMVIGVTEGFKKELEVEGVGFKVSLSGKKLTMALGFSHDVVFEAPEGIDLAVDGMKITVEGVSKQLVGQTAAQIRALKKPEPYKGKGIKYVGEYIIRKAGKTAAGGAE